MFCFNSYFLGMVLKGRSFSFLPLLFCPSELSCYMCTNKYKTLKESYWCAMFLGVLGSGRDGFDLFIPSGSLLPPFLDVLGRVSHLARSPISYFALAHCHCIPVVFQKSQSLNISITISIMQIHLVTFSLNC